MGALVGFLLACGVLVPPAWGQSITPPTVGPTPGIFNPPPSAGDPGAAPSTQTAVRVLQAPAEIGEDELELLAAELAAAPDATLVVRVPAAAKLDVPADSSVLAELERATADGDLVVVQQDGRAAPDGAAAILSAFADLSLLQPNATAPKGDGAVWDRVVELTGCADQCGATERTADARSNPELIRASTAVQADLGGSPVPLRAALEAPAPDQGGGLGIGAALLALVLLGAGAVFLLYTRRPRPATAAGNGHQTPPERQRARATVTQEPAPNRDRPRPRRAPARGRGDGRPAQVISVLDPEGYVELDRCLVRARWGPRQPAASPGEWVDVEDHGGRLWAFPNQSTPRPTAGRGA